VKSEHLFEAVGLVDDRLVEEAAEAGRARTPWNRWLATAACLLLVLGLGGVAAGTLLRGCGSKDSASPAETRNAAADMAQAPMAMESAPAEPETASGEAWMDEAAEVPAPTSAPEPSSMPEEAGPTPEAAMPSGNVAQETGMDFAGVPAYEIYALTVGDGAEVSARRALRLEVDGAETKIIDRYELSSGTGDELTARFEYPPGPTDGGTLRVLVDGEERALPDALELTVPARGAVTLELSCTAATGNFALLPASGLVLTEQTVQVALGDGWALETDLPGDPSLEPVAFDAEQARWTIRIKDAA